MKRNPYIPSRFYVVEIITGMIGLLLLFSLAVPLFARTAEKGNQTQGISNCKQVVTWLKLYSADHDGHYPDSVGAAVSSSNAAFRKLTEELAEEDALTGARFERIFGCPLSSFVPDGNIGTAPDYRETLKPGENHWAMSRGVSESSFVDIPLVYETPWEASWPPKWMSFASSTMTLQREQYEPPWPFQGVIPRKAQQTRAKGGSWPVDKIIVGLNDSSVSLLRLKEAQGDIRQFPPDDRQNNPFMGKISTVEREKLGVLDVEDSPGRKYMYTEDLWSLEMPQVAARGWWAGVGHLLMGIGLPALLYMVVLWLMKRRFLRAGSVVIIGVAGWFLLNRYHLTVEYPARLANAAAHGRPWQSVSWSNDVVYYWGWVEPLVGCMVMGFYLRRRKGRAV